MFIGEVQNKWKEVLNHEALPQIVEEVRRKTTAQVLENTLNELGGSGSQLNEAAPTNSMGASSSTAGAGAIDTFDPVLISLVRRAMPNLVAYDLCGVQAMRGPTGLIFAMRSRYDSQTGREAFYWEANTGHSARGGSNTAAADAGYASNTVVGGGANNVGSNTTYGVPGVSNNAGNSTYNYAGGMNRLTAEGLGGNTTAIFPEMAMSIEKIMVEAKSRGLKAEYSMEIAQDLKVIHGLEIEQELSNILSAEILAEINREIVHAINVTAKSGSQVDTTSPGTFDLDVDANGRWLEEKFKGMYFQLSREANQIAKDTRRGLGNVMICSADVASALSMAGVLSYAPRLNNSLQVDDTGNTFAGTLSNGIKVFIDPYAIGGNYWTVGYKGANAYDAGIIYCPYVPLQMVRAVDPNVLGNFKIGFKTRYGIVANPYADGGVTSGTTGMGYGALKQDANVYYRRTICTHLG